MSWWQSLILGLVQGLAEFLPISSSGHLVLARELMQIPGNYMLFDVLVHLGTVLAIFCAFFKEIIALFKPPFKTIGLILLASIPAALVGIFLNDPIESLFSSARYLCFFFLASAVIMLLAEIIGKRVSEPKPIGIKTAVIMGCMQAVAVFPGITRSGSTIFGGIAAKGKREEVARFSFFMSIPVILGAVVLTSAKLILKTDSTADALPVNWWCYVIGALAAFISGFGAIKLMLRVIAKADFKWFSLYLLLLSIATFIAYFIMGA